jgi:hypothetical protein
MRTWIDSHTAATALHFTAVRRKPSACRADLKAMEGSTGLQLVAVAGVRRVARVASVSLARSRHRAVKRKPSG